MRDDVASTTTAKIIVADLHKHGLDALLDPVMHRQLQRCPPEDREIRKLPNFSFHNQVSSP